jgi:glycerophosphoryl diester phosphodiesterase
VHRYGHRGGVPEAGENSLDAIQAAATHGYDGVELDVSRAAGGALVLWHDRTVLVQGSQRPVDQVSPEDLPGAPTLAQAIDCIRPTALRVNLDLKLRDPFDLALADQALALLAPLQGRCMVSSFDPRLLRHVAKIAPSVPRGLAWAPDLPIWLRSPAVWVWSKATGLHARHDGIDAALVARARHVGMAVTAWNLQDTLPLDRLDQLGVHAVIGTGIRRRDPSPH